MKAVRRPTRANPDAIVLLDAAGGIWGWYRSSPGYELPDEIPFTLKEGRLVPLAKTDLSDFNCHNDLPHREVEA